jgi:DnaK suppressor protein
MRTARTLTRGQLRELERTLRSDRARLERAMARTRSHRIALRMRGALTEEGHSRSKQSLTVRPRTLARHQELVAAIRRVEAGTYGVCRECEAPIPYERLLHSARTAHCAECAWRAAPEHASSLSL